MMGLQFVGIDIGTTTISGILFDPETRNFRSVTRKNASRLETKNDREDIQDPEVILTTVQDILDEFLALPGEVGGIGITGQMHGILYVGKDGQCLSPLYTWQDRRGDLNFRDDLSYAGFMGSFTGCAISAGYGLVTHYYNLKNNLVPYGSHKICTIMDYAVMKLSGNRLPVTDPTNAASLGLYDVQNATFDRRALKSLDIDEDILPEIVPSGHLFGHYNKEIYVCNAIGDNQASFLGAVNDIDKAALVNIGTGSQLSVYTLRYVEKPGLESRPFPGGGYLLVGSALSGGSSLEILKDFYSGVLNMFNHNSVEAIDFYGLMNSLQYSGEDLNELQVDVLFRGTRLDPRKRGSVSNISGTNFTPRNLTLGFIKGICDELYGFYEKIPEKNREKIQTLTGSGNAIRKNTLLCRVLGDTFGHRMDIPQNAEQAAFGACFNAMAGGNYITGYQEAGQFITYL